jgi:hypothetical protein
MTKNDGNIGFRDALVPDVAAIGVRSRSRCSEFMSIMCCTSWHTLSASMAADSDAVESASFRCDPFAGFEEEPRRSYDVWKTSQGCQI